MAGYCKYYIDVWHTYHTQLHNNRTFKNELAARFAAEHQLRECDLPLDYAIVHLMHYDKNDYNDWTRDLSIRQNEL